MSATAIMSGTFSKTSGTQEAVRVQVINHSQDGGSKNPPPAPPPSPAPRPGPKLEMGNENDMHGDVVGLRGGGNRPVSAWYGSGGEPQSYMSRSVTHGSDKEGCCGGCCVVL